MRDAHSLAVIAKANSVLSTKNQVMEGTKVQARDMTADIREPTRIIFFLPNLESNKGFK